MNEEDKIVYPPEWNCPITLELMKDPVIASDNFTYERKAIVEWMEKSDVSPSTGAKLESKRVQPNLALRQTIEQFFEKKEKPEKKEFSMIKNLVLPEISIKPIVLDCELLGFNEENRNEVEKIKKEEQQKEYFCLSLVAPEIEQKENEKNAKNEQNKMPCHFVCIIDTSESMDTDATVDKKNAESHGFSRLDLVKHSIKTMIEMMDPSDKISLISFNTTAKVVVHPTQMNVGGKAFAKKILSSLESEGTTNIWDGLKNAVDLLITHKENIPRATQLVLFTDGCPNFNPPLGIVPTFEKYLRVKNIPVPNLHVFGYGNEIDTELLTQLSEVGFGSYSYIPDCSMVGTVFISFLANSKSSIWNQFTIQFEQSDESIGIDGVFGFKQMIENVKSEKKTKKYQIGGMQYGQNREIFIEISKETLNKFTKNGPTPSKIANVSVSYGNESKEVLYEWFTNPIKELEENININIEEKDNLNIEINIRFFYLKFLKKLVDYFPLIENKKLTLKKCCSEIVEFHKKVEKVSEKYENKFVSSILKELYDPLNENSGQVHKSFERKEWYENWGKHYLSSLYRAHLLQISTNFKDPGLQNYGGKRFLDFEEKLYEIFIQLPAPVPTAKKVKDVVYRQAPVSMSSYYNYGGGCVHGQCEVTLHNGEKKKMEDLKKGDKIKGGKIHCIVKMAVFNHFTMIKIGKLFITPYHPVKIGHSWIFPIDETSGQSTEIFVDYLYNFVIESEEEDNDKKVVRLESSHKYYKSLICEGIECISLGHGIQNDSVASHEYFGSKIIEELKNDSGWNRGEIIIEKFIRDSSSNKVSGIVTSAPILQINE